MSDFALKRGDRLPPLVATLKNASNTAVDLTGCTVTFHMVDSGGTVVVNAAATIDDAVAGKVSFNWGTADTSRAGTYTAEFEVTFASGQKATFPNTKNLMVLIVPDLA